MALEVVLLFLTQVRVQARLSIVVVASKEGISRVPWGRSPIGDVLLQLRDAVRTKIAGRLLVTFFLLMENIRRGDLSFCALMECGILADCC